VGAHSKGTENTNDTGDVDSAGHKRSSIQARVMARYGSPFYYTYQVISSFTFGGVGGAEEKTGRVGVA
jgi:hypothetical protein